MEIKEGKYYRRRDGAIVGPIMPNYDDDQFVYMTDENGFNRTYTEAGRYMHSHFTDFDLIEEVEMPSNQNNFFGISAEKFTDQELAELGVMVANELAKRLKEK